MAYNVAVKLPPDPPLATSTNRSWSKGVITLIDQSDLPPTALKEANNLLLVELGQPRPRWGTAWYGSAMPNGAAIDGAFPFENSDGTGHIIAVAGGNIYRSVNDGLTWTLCTGATLTAGAKCYFEQASGYAFVYNGANNTVRYDGTTTLQSYTTISTPSTPTVTKTGLAATTYTYYYRISAVTTVGFTAASFSGTIQVSKLRNQWDASTNYVTLTWPAVTGAARYDIYMTDNAAVDNLNTLPYIASVSNNGAGTQTYIDTNTDPINYNIVSPVQNTTTGPLVADGVFIGSRIWLTRDSNNPYRVWWSGAASYLGYYSTSYDGGYIELQKGGPFKPVKCVDYRDGKGNQLTTVFCKSRDGRGCVWQISLGSLQAAGTSVTIPTAYKLPGSRGSDAPNSIISVLNDFMYWNTQAPGVFNLGSRAQFLNLLSTDESSANIRPNCIAVTPMAAPGIAGIFFRAKVLMSFPYGSTNNNATAVWDTERKAWLPYAFTIGFERFFAYGATDQSQHLLAWKTGDNRLSEISDQIQGDYGQPFATSLITGLMSTVKDRFEFMWVEEAELEFTQPKGTINAELVGIERTKGFSSLKSTSIVSRTSNVGWGIVAWDTIPWDDNSVIPQTYSESSVKRYFNVQKELNAYQYHITTNSLDADYILRTLQINGTPTNAGKPRQWLLT